MIDAEYVVVFISQRNSLRSVLARACLEHVSKGCFAAYSCGNPRTIASTPDELALRVIRTPGIALREDKQYEWNDLSRTGLIKADFVITMDSSIENLTPTWSGEPSTALWAYPDLLGNKSSEEGEVLHAATMMLHSLRRRLEILASLPMHRQGRKALGEDIRNLGNLS